MSWTSFLGQAGGAAGGGQSGQAGGGKAFGDTHFRPDYSVTTAPAKTNNIPVYASLALVGVLGVLLIKGK